MIYIVLMLRGLLFFLLIFSLFTPAKGVVIARQDFETSPATPVLTFTNTGGSTITGTSGTGDRPASANFYNSSSTGFRINNGTSTLLFPSSGGINLCSYENIKVSFKLASFSTGSTGNGAEATDYAQIDISPDGGSTWYSQIRVTGNSNACWSFSGGTAIASRAYSTTAFSTFAPAGGATRTSDGYSTVEVSGLPQVSNLRIRITMLNDAANERWVIDDVVVEGDLVPAAALSVCPSTAITGLNYLLGSGPSKEQTFQLTGSGLSPASGTVTITAPANFQVASNPAGPYSNSINIPYTGGNVTATPYYVRLVAGLSTNNYSGNINISNGTVSTTLSVSGSVRQDLFISEYVEGSSNNKYIEIFNPTSSTISLNNYRVQLFTNGSPTPTTTFVFSSGSISPCSTYVIGNASGSLYSPNTTSGVTNFNGDDALLLINFSTGDTLDIIGTIGQDPGTAWTAAGFTTLDKTLVRRPEVQSGVTSNPGPGFPTLGTQWIQYNIDEYRLLGNHATRACGNTIETLELTTSAPYCPGTSLPVSFNALGTYNPGNLFRVELSDENGLFGSPTVLSGSLSLSGVNPSGTVNAVIPSVSVTSADYRVRVTSSNPVSQTIINPPTGFSLSSSASLANVSSPSFTNTSGEVTLSWTLPTGCYDEIMIVATAASGITFSPSGNGSLYTASPAFSAFNQVVYKGTSNTTSITNLTDGTVYYFEIFTRLGTTWSSGIEIAAMPDRYCLPTISNSCDEYIYNIQLNTINNTTSEGCGFRGYSSFIDQSTTLIKGQSYTINVGVGIVGDGIDISYFDNDIRIWIDYDQDGLLENNATERIINLNDNGAAGTYTFTVPSTVATGTTRLRVKVVFDDEINACGNATYGETEDYTVNIIDPCTPNASISNFYPTSGPAGTEVRITGSNLNLVTAVSFNGIPATSFQILNSANILAIVPDGSGIGRITIADDVSCIFTSSSNFTEINPPVSCSGSYSDLFISEVVDPNGGNNHYVEIYNGTGVTVNLSSPFSYAIRSGNRGIPSDDPIYSIISLTGSIPNGETRVYYLGTNTANLATGTQLNTGAGYNDYDDVQLLKNGTVIDYYYTNTTTFFSARRRNNVVAPNPAFNAVDWDIVSPTTTADLSIFNATPPFQITTQPVDYSGCQIFFEFVTSVPGLSYQWKYNNNQGNNTGWTDLADGAGVGPFIGTNIIGATDNNLTITGDLTNLDNYQFYCEVSLSSCSLPSQAVQFNLEPGRYWRTVNSGSWTDVSNWNQSPGPIGPWAPACTYPTLTNSDSVAIEFTDSIYVEGGISVGAGKLYVDFSSKLRIEPGNTLEIGNLSGTDFILEGLLEDNSTSGNGLYLNDGATWRMGNFSELIKSGTSAVTKYRDQYEGGIANIPTSAIWRYRKVSLTNPPVLSANMVYPNLYFENLTTGSYIQTGTSALQTIQPCLIKGNLFIGEVGNPVTVRNAVRGTNILQINGNLFVGSGSTFTNIDGADNGNGIVIQGNITVDGTLSNNAPGSGRLILNGNLSQTISGIGTISIDTLIIDKPVKSLVKLNRNIAVTKLLQFGTGGIIQTDIYEVQVNNPSATDAIIGYQTPNNTGMYDNDKYVQGKLRRRIAANGTYDFPVGDSIRFVPGDTLGEGYNPVRMVIRTVPVGSPTALAEFIPVAQPDDIGKLNVYREFDCAGSTKFLSYTGLTGEGYWKMDGNTFNNYDIYLHPNIANKNNNPNEQSNLGYSNTYRALKEENSKAGAVWDPDVSTAGDPCIVSNTYYEIIGAGYSGFSIFAPGGGAGLTTPLPVELLSFTGTCNNGGVALYWATASEFNSDQFILEGSLNGADFTTIGYLPAAGFSNGLRNYTFNYDGAKGSFRYFRLAEKDFDGNITYYNIIDIDCAQENTALQLFYSPGEGIIASMYQERATAYVFQVVDAAGRLVFNSELSISGGRQRLNLTTSERLAKGIYFVSAYFNDKVVTEKVVIW